MNSGYLLKTELTAPGWGPKKRLYVDRSPCKGAMGYAGMRFLAEGPASAKVFVGEHGWGERWSGESQEGQQIAGEPLKATQSHNLNFQSMALTAESGWTDERCIRKGTLRQYV